MNVTQLGKQRTNAGVIPLICKSAYTAMANGVRLTVKAWLPEAKYCENYPTVVVDARGSGASFVRREAEISPAEMDEIGEVIDWIAPQPQCDDPVVTTVVESEKYLQSIAENIDYGRWKTGGGQCATYFSIKIIFEKSVPVLLGLLSILFMLLTPFDERRLGARIKRSATLAETQPHKTSAHSQPQEIGFNAP